MSQFIDTARAAIAQAVQAVDPTIRVYGYLIHPNDTSASNYNSLFGQADANGEPAPDATGSFIDHVAIISRTVPGSDGGAVFATSGDEVRDSHAQWQIEYFRTAQDPLNDPTVAEASEYQFQRNIDVMKQQLFLHTAMRALMISPWKGVVDSVSADEYALVFLPGGNILHHYARITLALTHKQSMQYI